MSEMGFGSRWCSWISECLSTASISILVNGSPSKEFPMDKGLRQGCSLSVLLFNIVGELLHLMLSKAVDKGLFQGFVIGKPENSIRLSHLQFADDLIIFCQSSLPQIKNVKRVLRIFSMMAGLHLNLAKSKLLGINMEEEVLTDWASQIGCSVGSSPTEYLVLPLGAKKNSVTLWDPVFRNLSAKLAGWKAICLSLADLNLTNWALLGKWVWKFANDKSSLWKCMLSSKHKVSCKSMSTRGVSHPQSSWILRGIANNYLKNDSEGISLRSNSKLIVGNGESIFFWNNIWADESPLKFLFPRIFVLSPIKEGKIAEFGSFEPSGWVWNVQTRRSLSDWELAQWMNLMSKLKDIQLLELVDDFLSWTASGDGLFSIKSCRSSLSPVLGSNNLWLKGVWLGFAPPRVEAFLWQLAHQKVAVKAELVKRGLPLGDDILCPLCKENEESMQHLFISCVVVWELCNKLASFWDVSLVLPQDPPSILISWGELRVNSTIWKFIPGVIFWSIWKVRNTVVFKGSPLDRLSLFFIVRFMLSKWFLAKFPKISIHEDVLIGNPSLTDGVTPSKDKVCDVFRWIPPPVDFLKLNADGAVRLDGLCGGIGENVGVGTPPLAELKAIKRGIGIFLSSSWESIGRLIFESDFSSAVEWIQSPILAPVFFSPLVYQISNLIIVKVHSEACASSVEDPLWKLVWFKYAPLKVMTFVWKVVHQRLPVILELEKRGFPLMTDDRSMFVADVYFIGYVSIVVKCGLLVWKFDDAYRRRVGGMG
ncbi:uncharacterized protein LOC120129709 [Hibiscus syriacus]|uniref:uncharacterized protein LOC120129709 n=1 Tax=Hibiscus syriacus TaxID=106335 RepID=UPI0019239C91|nr:uncharacterized protein LOC120129709 [Hibiscus syriacus]